MLFFPYAPDVNLFRFPILTLAVCLACVTVTYFQYADDRHVTRTIDRFCSEKAPRSFQLALWKIQEPEWKSCPYLMHSLYWSRDREGLIARIARLTPDPARAAGVLSERYGRLSLIHI